MHSTITITEPIMEEEQKLVDTSEIDLIRRAQAGNHEAFVQLYRSQAGHVYAIALRMLADAEGARELAQRAIVRAWQTLGGFRFECPFSAWIHRITVRLVLDHLRAERRLNDRVEFTDDPEILDLREFSVDTDAKIDLETAIATLPVQARTVLVLHDIEGYHHEEIAGMMGIAAGTAKAHLHRARTLLKERLQR